jgi:L-glyceraldehyde 3-phosphate reductase
LTDKYLNGIPSDSRAGKEHIPYFKSDRVTDEILSKVKRLNKVAKRRGQSLAQLALAWVLRQPALTSALIGASKVSQIEDAVDTINNLIFSNEELSEIENILSS